MAGTLKATFCSYARRKWFGDVLQFQRSSTSRSSEVRVSRPIYRGLCTASAASSKKVYPRHTFYKGKAALSIAPGRPIFKLSENGDYLLEKEGTLFMEFAPSTGPRQYDWSKKQIFALSIVEMGGLISLTTSENIEFFHDPHIGSSNAGMVRKCLKVEGMADKSGFFFNMSISNKLDKVEERFTVPVTKAEFAVMRSSFNFLIPYFMGWHAYVNSTTAQLGDLNNEKVNPELEWVK